MEKNLYHQRVVVLKYNERTIPKFQTQAEIDAWHQAVGRMVCYGLIQDGLEDATDLVFGTITDRPLELCCGYYPAQPSYPEKYEDGYPKVLGSLASKVEQFVTMLNGGRRPFVVGAILHSDGKWGFHS